MNKINLRQTLKNSFFLIKKNFLKYILVIIMIESILLVGFNELIKSIFNLALISGKVSGINNNNFITVISNPLVILVLLLLILIAAALITLQYVITYYYMSNDFRADKNSFRDPLLSLRRIKYKHLMILLIYIFLIMPNGNIGISSGLTSKIHIPNFVLSALQGNLYFMIFYYLMISISFYLNLRFFYTFVIFTNENVTFFEAMKKSWVITKKNTLKILTLIIIISILSLLFIFIIYLINFGLFNLSNYLFSGHVDLFRSIFQRITMFMYTIILSIATILVVQVTVVSYNQLNGKEIVHKQTPAMTISYSHKSRVLTLLGAGFVFFFLVAASNPAPKFTGATKIVSHRGESVLAIENTLESLRIASSYHPDYIEMDIQQINDNEIIVFHDPNLRRLTSNTRSDRVTQLSLSDIKNVTLRHGGYTSTIPTLKEYLVLAKELNQKIMIEIKVNSTDSLSYIDDIMNIVNETNMQDLVVFQSLNIDILLKLKEKYPEVVTGYILGIILTGGLENYNIDFYSIESSSITQRVLNDLEKYNKALFVWTINTEEDIALYLGLEVHGIITDNTQYAVLANEELQKNHFSNILFNLDFKLLS